MFSSLRKPAQTKIVLLPGNFQTVLKSITLLSCMLFSFSSFAAYPYPYRINKDSMYAPIAGTGTPITLGEYAISDSLPIGFAFPFFGNEYTHFFLSSKGFISFTHDGEVGCCPNQQLPDNNAPNNLIAFDWGNLDPSAGGSISYFTTGIAPHRQFVLNFVEIPSYNGSPEALTSQLILNERSGIIEIHSQKVPFNEQHTMGIENADGSIAYTVAGRNAEAWNASNERVRFVPLAFNSKHDLGVLAINTGAQHACAGTYGIQAQVQNFGIDTVNNFVINWSLNGVLQTPINVNSTIEPIANSTNAAIDVALGTKVFSDGVLYTIKGWTSAPNGLTDTLPQNDTSTLVFRTALNGSYTVGGSSPDFSTPAEAVAALNQYGVCGPVTFTIRNGNYNEQLHLSSIVGASLTNTITFQSSSGNNTDVIISYAATSQVDNYVLWMEATDFVTVKNITLKALGTMGYGTVIRLNDGSEVNNFVNNVIQGIEGATDENNASVIVSASGNNTGDFDNNNTFLHNQIIAGAIGLNQYAYNNGGESNTSDLVEPSDIGVVGLRIEGNTFTDQKIFGISVRNLDGVEIIKNNIISSNPEVDYFRGIQVQNSYNHIHVLQNKIDIGRGYGIFLTDVYNYNGEDKINGLVANNFVHVGGSGTAYGLYMQSTNNMGVYHNSVHINSTDSSNGKASFFYYPYRSRIMNNIFSNSGNGHTLYIYGINEVVIDYNDYYTNGSVLGYANGNVANIAALRAATGQDLHSISLDPLFVSANDLHVNASGVNSKGKYIPDVSVDIDDQLRSLLPDIGADEFFSDSLDASLVDINAPKKVFKSGSNIVKVALLNNASNVLSSAVINWQLNGVNQSPYNWAGNLSPGDTAQVILGNSNFVIGTPYRINAWLSSANGTVDPISGNDSIQVDSLYAGLSGTYTIGGSNPDFDSIKTAVIAMVKGGVYGPVTFNIRDGIYSEQLVIPAIEGASNTNRVVFQSESNDSTDVTIRYAATTNQSNFVLYLNGADYFTFRKLTIEASGSSYATAVNLENGACNNIFSSNLIKSPAAPNTSTSQAVIRSNASYLKYNCRNAFTNNEIYGGAYGIYIHGYSSGSYADSGLVVSENKLTNQYYMGMSVDNQTGNKIAANTISTTTNYYYFYGIYLNNCYENVRVEKNKLFLSNGAYGIYANYCHGSLGNENSIVNNFVSIGGNSVSCYGIYLYQSNYQNIYHNSVSISNTVNSSSALNQNACNNIILRNNIFANTGGGYAIHFNNSSLSTVSSDYNDLYSSGLNLGYSNNNIISLSDWQKLGIDPNSLSVKPSFVSFTDLHINKAALNNAGISLPEVTTDIDGEVRQSKPDVGADEFNVVGENAALFSVLPPAAPFKSGVSQPVKVKLRNSGQSTLTSATINWKVNNVVQATVNWTGSLAVGLAETVDLGDYVFATATNHSITAWVSSPNGTSDIDPEDDTAKVNNVYPALEGVYTIGGTSPSFISFTSAVQSLTLGGILNSVTFNVRNGTYNEQISLSQFPGSSCAIPVVFQSESDDSSKVIVNSTSSDYNKNYVVQLNGADGISFRKMTFSSSSSYYARLVEILNGSDCNHFMNNAFIGSTTQSGEYAAIVYSISSSDNYNEFGRSLFKNGTYGIYLTGDYNFREKGTSIHDNFFQDQTYRGIYLRYLDSTSVRSNAIQGNGSNGYFYGIGLQYCYYNNVIEKNRVVIPGGGYGINMEACYATVGTENRIRNNFISVGGTSTARGLYISGCNNLLVDYNSVSIGNSTNPQDANGIYLYSGSYVTLRNNIFYNAGNGQAIFVAYVSALRANYNDLFTNGPVLGVYNYVNQVDLAAWKVNGIDSNAISINPYYASFTNLHSGFAGINGKAKAILDIADDIDGEPRDLTSPDMGADEFDIKAQDAGILSLQAPLEPFPSGANDVGVLLINNSSSTLSSASINWSVNGSVQSPYNWNGSLAPGDTTTVTIGSYSFAIRNKYLIKTWTSSPNGLPDMNVANDTIVVDSIYAALGGIYTLGGSSPDFINFNEAATSLAQGGVIDSVLFKVRTGGYTEQFVLPVIKGTSASHPVIFESESGDSSSVLLSFVNTNTLNYIVQLNGADYVTFRKMSFESKSPSYGIIFDIRNGATNNKFYNNYLKGTSTTATSNGLAIFNVSTFNTLNNDNLEIRNSLMRNGSSGLFLNGYGSYTSSQAGVVIQDNIFENQSYAAAIVQNQQSFLFKRNSITTGSTNNTYGLLMQSNYNSIRVEKNKIVIPNGYGIYAYNTIGSFGNESLILNNFVSVGSSNSTAYGIFLYYGSYQRVYYNSVNIVSSSTNNGMAFYSYYGSSITALNNIFANTGKGYAVYNYYTSGLSMDRNDLFTNGTVLGYWQGTTTADLAAWKTASSQDANSVSVDPHYISATDLHISPLLSTALNAKAQPVSAVTTDIDEQPRDPSSPDLGADEFSTTTNDAGILAIAAPKKPFAAGNSAVRVYLLNNANLPLDSVRIDWSINNVSQSQYKWTGHLDAGDTALVTLGNHSFGFDTLYAIRVYTSLPNGVADEEPRNDTAQVDSLYPGLVGIYTIGGTNPDFLSFGKTVEAMKKGGLLGPVTFNVRNGTYTEQLLFPSGISGSNATNTITYTSESGDSTLVLLTYNASQQSNYIVRMDGADYITFSKITFKPTNTSYARAVDLRNGANNIAFLNNVFSGVQMNSTSYELSLFYSADNIYTPDNNTLIKNNLFQYGSVAITIHTPYNYWETGNVIEGNKLENQYYKGIDGYGQQGMIVRSNTITTTSSYTNFFAVEMLYGRENNQVLKNKINVSNSGTGIQFSSCTSTSGNEGLIANNFVSIAGLYSAYGINLSNCSRQRIYHNNTFARSTYSTPSYSAGLYLYGGSELEIQNNIFANNGKGYSIYSLYPGTNLYFDYNAMHTKGTNIGFYNADATTLNNWRVFTNADQHSVDIDPMYSSLTDLHVTHSGLNNSGVALGISEDIDGEIRSLTKPDIGADEFSPTTANDAGVFSINTPVKPFADGNQPIWVSIKNYGAATLTSAIIKWEVNGSAQADYIWTGSLAQGELDSVQIGTYSFVPLTEHVINAWSSLPNGVADILSYNDSTVLDQLYPALNGAYTIGGTNPDFVSFTEAVKALDKGGIIGPVTFNVRNGTYEEQISIPAIVGSSATNTILFQSQSGDSSLVRLGFNGHTYQRNYVVQLNGADYVTLQKMTIEVRGNYGIAVDIRNGSDNATVARNIIKAVNTSSTGADYSAIYIPAVNNIANQNTSIRFNVIKNGSEGIVVGGLGTTTKNLLIEGNVLENQYRLGIDVNLMEAPQLLSNTITTNSSYTNYYGMLINNCSNALRVNKNKINCTSGYGINMQYCYASSGGEGLLSNNFISVTGTVAARGISLYGCDYHKFIFNSINVSSTHATEGRAFYTYGGSNFQLVDNIFANTGGGYAIYFEYPGSFFTFDYNDYYTSGAVLGYTNAANRNNFAAWKAANFGQDEHSLSIDPLFYSSSDLHINQIALDSSGLSYAGITSDIDGNVRQSKPDIGADEFAYTPNDIGASLLIAPKTGCGLANNASVVVQITNYGGLPQSGFNVSYAMNGGATVTENVGGLTVQPGGKSNYTFTAVVNVSATGVYNFRTFTQSASDAHPENDTLVTNINSYPILAVAPANMIPADNAKDIGSPIDFSWSPTPNALYYDIYVWLDSLSRPSAPSVSGVTGINYKYYNSGLLYGATYKWQIIARNSCSDTASAVQRFTIFKLSDLSVTNITVPPTAFSGQNISFNWTVKNNASGSTGSQQWYDQVFLSADTTFSPTLDKVLGTISNFSALNAGQSYLRPATFTLPNGITGNYYLFVKTDSYNNVKETNEYNNMSLSAPVAISLTPPPDVRVSAIVTPQDAFSGQGINFSFTVKNDGAGDIDANDWYDRVFLSADTLLSASDPKIGEYHHIGKLKSDSSYTQSKSIDLPDGISGPYYLFVQTDVFNQVYEYVFEGNNTRRSDSINVILSPPVDYLVTSVVGKTNVSNKDTLTITWTVENQGGSTPKTFSWSDDIYLSPNGNGDLTGALLVASTTQYTKLAPFTSYTAKQKVNVPDNINGSYFIYVVTDATNRIFEHTLENNNIGRSDTSILVMSPDLIVSSVTAPAIDSSGKSSLIKWTVKNNGAGKLVSGSWKDYVYISSAASFNGSAIKIDSLEYSVKLDAGDTIAKQKTVKVPNGISGTYYFYVLADGNNKIYEYLLESNNVNRSAVDNIILSPWSDLQPSLIQAKDTMNAGDALAIKFNVRNNGLAKTDVPSWKDKVYISKDATWSINAILIGTAAHGGALSPDSSYLANVNVVLPPSLLKGNYYVYVITDSENEVYEHTAENNNRIRSNVIYVNAYPPVDLSVTNAVYHGTPASGKPLTIEWTVKNNGEGATTAPAWNDAVYLSLDSIWDKQSDIFVAEYAKDGPLKGGATYQVKKAVTLPNGISGLYYLLVVTDQQFKNPDIDLNNNDRTTQDSLLSGAEPINIILTAPADLVVSAFTAPVVVTSGQPFRVDWTVTNQGTGNTIKANWVERVYLSTDNVASNDDISLGSYVRNGSLAAGIAYSDTLRINVPASASGNYFLIIKSDNNDVVYEYLNENNNTRSLAMNVVRPPASDLIVSSITAPFVAVAGQSANISWKTKNNSGSAVSGALKEAVYFSADSLWDLNDVLLGTYDAFINLAPQAENTRAVTADIPGLALGDYYILVQTDILNNIFESNDTNNTSASAKVTVDVLNLPINVLTSNTLTNKRNLYYKIEVPDSLQGESMLISLKADSLNANNELYVKFGSMPDKVIYDYTQDNPFQGNQEIILPNLKTGTYYILLNGATSVGTTQNITLLARILNFEIRSVDANKGGNTGFITVLIRGSKFESDMKLRLEKGTQSIQADSILFVDPTKIYARFNLQGAFLGEYDVVAENSKQQLAILNDGFEVLVGIAPELLTNILHPSSTRISSFELLTIQFTNAGNTDLVNPILILHSVGGAPVGFTQAELSQLKTDLTIPLQELNGPPGVLRPGAIGSVIIYTKAVSTLGFLVEIPNFD